MVTELIRQTSWAETEVPVHHYRERGGAEVDLVLEAADGRLVGIEIKASRSLRPDAFKWLARLRDRVGTDFVHGFVLYAGADALPFGDRLTALPIAALWRAR